MTMEPIIYEKRGAGAYRVEIHPDAVYVWYGTADETATARQFKDVRHAYDAYRGLTEGDNSAWNICYMLEDHLSMRIDELLGMDCMEGDL